MTANIADSRHLVLSLQFLFVFPSLVCVRKFRKEGGSIFEKVTKRFTESPTPTGCNIAIFKRKIKTSGWYIGVFKAEAVVCSKLLFHLSETV